MHFLLIGATGRTGKVVLKESLEQGHTVTALVRNPASLPEQAGVTAVKGSSMEAAEVSAAFTAVPDKKVDAVLVTLNAQKNGRGILPENLMEKSISNVATSMKQNGVRKLVVMTANGTGDSWENSPWYLRGMMKMTHLYAQFQDHDAAHRIVKGDESIDWVFPRPMRLTDDDNKNFKDCGDVGKGVSGFATCSTASVAKLMVDAAAGTEYNRRTPVITN